MPGNRHFYELMAEMVPGRAYLEDIRIEQRACQMALRGIEYFILERDRPPRRIDTTPLPYWKNKITHAQQTGQKVDWEFPYAR